MRVKKLIPGASFVKNSVAKRIFAELSPETQSATLKFELWEAGMTLEYVLVVVAIISCIASIIGTVYAALTYHKKK